MDARLEEHSGWIDHCADLLAKNGKLMTARLLRESLAYLLARIEASTPIPYEVTDAGKAALGVRE